MDNLDIEALKIIHKAYRDILKKYPEIKENKPLYTEEDLKKAYNMGAANMQQQEVELESMVEFEDWYIWWSNTRKK